MIINHNIAAQNTYNRLTYNNSQVGKSLEKLSSGLRINRAGDDAAGLAISEKMRAQIRGLDQATRNAQDGISLIQTGEGALNEMHSILQRMRELAVQATNDTNTDSDRGHLQDEIEQLSKEIDRIANTTEFNTRKLINGEVVSISEEVNGTVNVSNNSSAKLTIQAASLTDVQTTGTVDGAFTVTRIDGNGANAANAASYDVRNQYGEVVSTATFTGATTGPGTVTFAAGSVATNAVTFDIDGMENFKAGDSFTVSFTSFEAANTDASKAMTLLIGANSGQTMMVGFDDLRTTNLGIRKADGTVVSVADKFAANATVATVDVALEKVSKVRANLGAVQNRLEHTVNNLGAASENLGAAESRVRDVDMAKQMMSFTKDNILVQAATAMLAQANQTPQSVLQLLQ